MRINNYFTLRSDFRPVPRWIIPRPSATKKQYDSVAIIHYGKNFRPIVLTDKFIQSSRKWRVPVFYRELCELLKLEKNTEIRGNPYYLRRRMVTYRWGCREFTKSQLELIKKTMKQEYTKEELEK